MDIWSATTALLLAAGPFACAAFYVCVAGSLVISGVAVWWMSKDYNPGSLK